MKTITAVIFAMFLITAEGIAQTPGAAEWSVSNLQMYPVAKIDGTNGAIVTDKSALVEVVGNVSSLNAAPTGARVPLPVIHLSGTSALGPWSVEPIAIGLDSPLGCRAYYFLAATTANNANPNGNIAGFDVENGKVRITGGSAISLCFAFSTPPSSEMIHFEFAGVDKALQVASARRPDVIAPPLSSPGAPTAPSCNPTEPHYSDDARKAHVEGQVVLGVIVHTDGLVEVVKVLKGLGYGLDEEAQAAVSKWKCAPGTVKGQPVNVQLQVVINFRLIRQAPNPQ
jgi:TonB family protein